MQPSNRPPKTSSEPALETVLKVSGAVKKYGRRRALDELDLEVKRGQWVGLIGPNGAGKTTLMLSIAGLIALDAGRIDLLGNRVTRPRPDDIGWVPQGIALYAQLTARENLEAFGILQGVARRDLDERVAWALDWSGLESRAQERVATFSGGMQRRLNIACAALHRPRLLLLDEPTVGVDPQARSRTFAMLETLRDSGVALLHSSHELDDIETTCDKLTIMDRGRAVASGSVHELVQEFTGGRTRVSFELNRKVPEIETSPMLNLVRQSGRRYTADLEDVASDLPRLFEHLARHDATIGRLELDQPGLRQVFLDLTGKDLRE